MGMLYEKCPACRGGMAVPARQLADGSCPGCLGHRFVAIGLTAAQLGRMAEALDEGVEPRAHHAGPPDRHGGGGRMASGPGARRMGRPRSPRDADESRPGPT